jgi:hypothetical protein
MTKDSIYIQIVFGRNITGDRIQVKLGTIQSRTCLLIYYPKTSKLEYNKTIILPVVLYGCETWSLALREAYRLRRDEVTVGYNKELCDL